MQTIIDYLLTGDAYLMVWMYECQTFQCFCFADIAREIKVYRVEHFVVCYAAGNNIVKLCWLSGTTRCNKIKPFFVIGFKLFDVILT